MLRKKCKICGKNSYSASEHRLWLCPYCNCDLTKEKAMIINEKQTNISIKNNSEND